jgi:hypothetical protein
VCEENLEVLGVLPKQKYAQVIGNDSAIFAIS